MAVTAAIKAINSQEVTEKARKDLLLLLEGVRGKKNLVIERSLAGTIGLFVKFSTLQEYGVDKIFFLENHNVDHSQRNVIFLIRGEKAETIRTVAEQIKLVRTESSIDHEFTLILTPRRTLVSNVILEESGVLGETSISELPLYFIPLEPDLLSLELNDSFSELCLRKVPACIFTAAKALMTLQEQYGLIPRILGKGDNAKRLSDLLQRMRSEEDVSSASDSNTSSVSSFGLTTSSIIENLIVIDREVDFPTVLSTQLTYEGLIDENYGINNNQVELDSSIQSSTPASSSQHGATQSANTATKRRVQLDSSDKLYPSLRDANFATIGPLLNQTARRLMADQQVMHNKDQSIADLKNVVAKLPTYQAERASLVVHTNLSGEILKITGSPVFRQMLEVQQNLLAGSDASGMHENIEELIARGVSLKTVLRLLCLESCLSNGIRQRELDSFKRQVLSAYGFQHMITLSNLEKTGLLLPRESHRGYLNPIAGTAGQTATDWNAVRKNLTLWIDEVNESEPNDIAYVFSGYAPVSVRLVQCILQKSYIQGLLAQRQPNPAPTGGGWKHFEDTLARIRGATVDVAQKGADADASHARKTLRGSKDGPKVSIVFFVGGITYAEIAALRFVSKQLEESSGRRLIIGTTNIINGNHAVDCAMEKRRFGEE